MIKKWCRAFAELNYWLKIIWIFCCAGAFINLLLICRDLANGGILLRLHIGFFILYIGQVVFILLKERMVFVLSLLQALLAFVSNLDFTFVPVVRVAGHLIYSVSGGLSLEALDVYKYVLVSFCLTAELLKTWLLYDLIPSAKKQTDEENSSEIPTESTQI